MERKPCLLVPLSVAGTMVGLAYGRSQTLDLWPDYARLYTIRCAGVGWLVGLVLAGLVLLISKPRLGPARRPGGFVRAARVVAITLALAPGALWVSALLPGSPLRQAMSVRWPGRAEGPNIVLISIDALRADHLGAYGSNAGLTPNLDAFAREATVYRSAVAASPWTLASLGALFTGLSPSQSVTVRKGNEDTTAYAGRATLLGRAPLLSEALSSAGYRTAAELTNPFLSAGRGWERGFDFFRNEDGGDALVLLAGETARADRVTEHARAWLALKRRPPFFLWVHYLDPHAPYDSPDAPEALRREYPSEWETGRTYWYETMVDAKPEEQARFAEYCRKAYAEEVRYADRWVGELLADLKRRGLYDEAAIAITSDHGEELFEHGGFEHGHSMHAEVLHVPLLVKWPKGTAADRTIAQTVSLESLGPTLLELAGVSTGQGVSAAALPRQEAGGGAGAYSEAMLYGPDQSALTTDDYKVIYHLPTEEAGESFEVYDRRADPGERHDLAAEGVAMGESERLRRMTEAAMAARAEQGAGEAPKVELNETAKRRLKSLGYLSD
jgi:arylsulfatase A-like enzyme